MAEVYRIGASALSDEGGWNRILSQRLPQDGPMHCFVAQDAPRRTRQVTVVEYRNRAQICAHRIRLEPRGEAQDIRLGFQGFNRNCRETHGVTDG